METTTATVRLLIAGFLLLLTPLAQAVMCGENLKAEANGDEGYAVARQALEHEDWSFAVASLQQIIERRAWDDDAHALLGFAFRKLGKIQRALDHYHRVLGLNPYHGEAMASLGELYLELGEDERAKRMLARLEETCRRMSQDRSAGGRSTQCKGSKGAR